MNDRLKKFFAFLILTSFALSNILIYPFTARALSVSTSEFVPMLAAGANCFGISTITNKITGIFGDIILGGSTSGSGLVSTVTGGGLSGAHGVPVTTFADDGGGAYYNLMTNWTTHQRTRKDEEKRKERCEDSIVNQMAKFLIRKLVDDLAQWLRGGMNGKPRFIQNFGAYLREAGDIAGGIFLEQLLGDTSLLCKPWRFDVSLELKHSRQGFSFQTQCRISQIVDAFNKSGGINIDINGKAITDTTVENSFDDFSRTGWLGFIAATFNNPMYDFMKSDAELMRRIEAAKEKSTLEAKVNQGLLLSTCVKDFTGFGGKKCLKTEITSPGVAIAGAVGKLFNGEVDELFLADEINELIVAAIDGIKARRLWSDEGVTGLSTSGGNTGWLADNDPQNAGARDTFNPPDSTKDTLIFQIESLITEEQQYLSYKKQSKAIIENDIIPMLDQLILKATKQTVKNSLKSQKNAAQSQLTEINKQITDALTIVYEPGTDPIENLLTSTYPEWSVNAEQKTAFCAESIVVSGTARLLSATKANLICAENNTVLNDMANLINNTLPLLIGSSSAALSEYKELVNLKNSLSSQLGTNSPLGSHETSDGTICAVKGWAYDPDTPSERVNVRALKNGDENNVLMIGAADFQRNDISTCAPGGNLCGFELYLIGIVPSNTPTSVTVQAEDTSDLSWYNLTGTPQTLTCI